MHVLQINTRATSGGAARACLRLHKALRRAGHEGRIVSFDLADGRPEMQSWLRPSALARALYRLNWAVEMRLGLEGIGNVTSWLGYRRHAEWADVINLHNIHSFYFSMLLLPRLERHAPLVWTLHDMWAMTGHCAYPIECPRWLMGCGECRNLLGPPRIDVDTTRLLYRARRRVYARINPVLVSPSRWLRDVAQRAPLTSRFRAECIPNGLELDVYRPQDRAAARRALGVGPDERVVLFSANSLTRWRKGEGLLAGALERLRRDGFGPVRLLSMGEPGGPVPGLPYPLTDLGPLSDDQTIAQAYSAADVFVLPTRADNLPNTLVESIACGTPCVATRVGGVPDVVRPGVTGWLAEPEDQDDLARCIAEALSGGALLRAECRRVAEAEYGVELMCRRYEALYEELVRARRAARSASRR